MYRFAGCETEQILIVSRNAVGYESQLFLRVTNDSFAVTKFRPIILGLMSRAFQLCRLAVSKTEQGICSKVSLVGKTLAPVFSREIPCEALWK